jgi:hypothetical protein
MFLIITYKDIYSLLVIMNQGLVNYYITLCKETAIVSGGQNVIEQKKFNECLAKSYINCLKKFHNSRTSQCNDIIHAYIKINKLNLISLNVYPPDDES